MKDLDIFINATIEALYFTDTGEEGQPNSDAELAPETMERLKADCTSFWHRMNYYLEPANQTASQAGHDFWLTRNGHGAGFWDGEWPKPYDDMLTKLAEAYGVFETYTGDDGLIYA
jgi:hypothetical protein